MTAINVVLRPDRAVILTDGLTYNQVGLVMGQCQKTIAMPTIKAAIAVRGAQKVAGLLAMELSALCYSFDDLLEEAEGFFVEWASRMLDVLQVGTDNDMSALANVEIVVAGWSDKHRKAMGFYFLSHAAEPFGWIDEWAFGPLPSDEEEANLASIGAAIETSYSVRSFDPIRHGVPLLEAQRRMKIDPPGLGLDEPISIVGAHVLVTECGPDGVSQRVVHRWNDKPGETIVAEPFQADARSGLSRQQRRAMGRARKQEVA